jgi:hypothetical protein
LSDINKHLSGFKIFCQISSTKFRQYLFIRSRDISCPRTDFNRHTATVGDSEKFEVAGRGGGSFGITFVNREYQSNSSEVERCNGPNNPEYQRHAIPHLMWVEKPSKIALVHENLCPVVRRFKYRHEETTTIKMTNFMDIIHRLMIIKIHDVSETGICLRHQVTGEGYLV